MSKLYSIAAASLLLVACFGNDIVVDSDPIAPTETVPPTTENPAVPEIPQGEPPVTPASVCSHDDLCRLNDPADTLLLSSEQKDRARRMLDDTLDYVRAGITRLDVSALQGDSLRLEIFPDIILTIETKDISTSSTFTTWTGEVAGESGGTVTLTLVNNSLFLGSIQYDGKTFSLFSLGDGLVMVYEVNMMWNIGDCVEFANGSMACP